MTRTPMLFVTVLRRNDRLNLTGMFYEPKGVAQRDYQVERNLSPPFAYYSLCGKVNIAHETVYCFLSIDISRSDGCSHPVPR